MKKRLVLVAVLSGMGCAQAATPAVKQVMPLEQRMLLLERKVKALSDLSFRLDALQREVQQLRGEIEVQNHTLDSMSKRQRALYLDIDQRLNEMKGSQKVPTQTSTTSSPANPTAVTLANPPTQPLLTANTLPVNSADPAQEEQQYQQAFEILKQRRYAEAKTALAKFLVQYPAGSLADNAQYWLAETSYVMRDFDTAQIEFSKVLEQYPNSSKVPDALLKSGFIQYERKNWTSARGYLEKVVKAYSTSSAARLAQQRLERMRSEGH